MIAIIGTWEMSPPLPCPPDESFNSGTSVKERHMLQLLMTDPTNTLTDRKKTLVMYHSISSKGGTRSVCLTSGFTV